MTRFSPTLIDHYESPRNRGVLSAASTMGVGHYGGSPPRVVLRLRIAEGKVQEAAFEAEGCGVTIALGSALTELLVGRAVTDCSRLEVRELEAAVEWVPADKAHCVMVVIDALRSALANYQTTQCAVDGAPGE